MSQEDQRLGTLLPDRWEKGDGRGKGVGMVADLEHPPLPMVGVPQEVGGVRTGASFRLTCVGKSWCGSQEGLGFQPGYSGCSGAGPSFSSLGLVKTEELPLTFSNSFLATLVQVCISNEASPAGGSRSGLERWS